MPPKTQTGGLSASGGTPALKAAKPNARGGGLSASRGLSSSGGGQTMSRIRDTLEDSYIDLESYILTKLSYLEDRFKKLSTKKKRIEFIQTYVSKMQTLIEDITPDMRGCLNAEFPEMLFTPNTRYEQPFYAKVRAVLTSILTEEERIRFHQSRDFIAFYERILEQFNDETFVKAYVKTYSKPFNMYAFYLLQILKQRLKIDIRYCSLLQEGRLQLQQQAERPSQPQPRNKPIYKHQLDARDRYAFTYKWLKTEADIQSICKDPEDDDDECCDCAINMTPLTPNKAFSVSYVINNKTYTDCYDEIMLYIEDALPYAYYRHPILQDYYIDMGAIRALKAAANATGGAKPNAKGGGAPALKATKSNTKGGGLSASGGAKSNAKGGGAPALKAAKPGSSTGGKRVRLGASKRV